MVQEVRGRTHASGKKPRIPSIRRKKKNSRKARPKSTREKS